MKLGKYSIGVGDRFTYQGEAQLRAIMKANEKGVDIVPVWNKSNREHIYVGTKPMDHGGGGQRGESAELPGAYFGCRPYRLDTVTVTESSDFSR